MTREPREIRLALVMNGGVSLAVWMGGVTHEIDLLRRASTGILPPDGADLEVYNYWRDLCTTLNVTVSVDIIAGASAGGLNGTLLAAAIARGAPLPALRDTWIKVAQLSEDQLLWPAANETAPSVLNGDVFQQRVTDVFESIGSSEAYAQEEVTLFVTATAIGDQPKRIRDDAGVSFTFQDHRRLYRFAQTSRRTYPQALGEGQSIDLTLTFPPEKDAPDAFAHSSLLARAARASSSFPVAFAPMPEKVIGTDPDLATFRPDPGDDAWLMDGGVLDNAPFAPVVGEIARRPVDRPWRRALVYIVPSVEASRSSEGMGEQPGWQRVVTSALNLPREADLRDDIETLKHYAGDAQRWGEGPQRLFAELQTSDAVRKKYRAAAEALFPDYRQARINGGITDALSLWARAQPSEPINVAPVFTREDQDVSTWVPTQFTDFDPDGDWLWGTAVADRVLHLLLRNLARLHEDSDSGGAKGSLKTLSDVVESVAAVRDAVLDDVRRSAPGEPTAANAIDAIRNAIEDLSASRVLGQLVRAGAEAYLAAVPPAPADAAGTAPQGPPDVPSLITDTLIIEVLTLAFAADKAFNRPVRFDFFRFGPDIDSPLVTIPDPNNPSDKLPLGPWKLWGSQLGHFAAFGQPSWREADWLWGRLDGAAHLVRLLTAESKAISREKRGPGDVGSEKDLAANVQAAQLAVLNAVGSSQQDLTSSAAAMVGLEPKGVLEKWEGAAQGGEPLMDVLDSVLRMLRTPGLGNNKATASIGNLLSIALGQDLPDSLKKHRLARLEHLVAKRLLHLRSRIAGHLKF